MRLLGELYTILDGEPQEGGVRYKVRFHEDSVIYKAHFPGHPVTPGACLVEMAQELLETFLASDLRVKTIKNVKFLSIISPLEVKEVSFQIQLKQEDEWIQSQILVFDDKTTYAKISLVCQKP